MYSLYALGTVTANWKPDGRLMPVLFVGHGSPMNAIEENAFSRQWRTVAGQIPLPRAIICISAHWETKGTLVTAMEKPKTIHDFYGFPQALNQLQYPAPGSPQLAAEVKSQLTKTTVNEDYSWGLDHGSWSILEHFYPEANIPVIQLSLDYTKPAAWHYELAQELSALREKGVLIIGSGNMVHNLRLLNFNAMHTPYDWALEINDKFKAGIAANDHGSLINLSGFGRLAELAVPSAEHYLPMLYILGLQRKNEQAQFFNDVTLGSISMTSFRFG